MSGGLTPCRQLRPSSRRTNSARVRRVKHINLPLEQQPGSYQGGEMMMMKSVFWWRKPPTSWITYQTSCSSWQAQGTIEVSCDRDALFQFLHLPQGGPVSVEDILSLLPLSYQAVLLDGQLTNLQPPEATQQ